MALENIPWAILGGIHSASVARMLAYQSTGGAEGVAGIGDFAVKQSGVASGTVQVAAGGATIINRYPGVINEAYTARAGTTTDVAIAANASGVTRHDLLVIAIDDWNFPGGQATPASLPTDAVPAVKFQVITNVPVGTRSAADLNLNYPALALALISIPASTSAITQQMITDLRNKVAPRTKRDLNVNTLDAGRSDALDATGGEQWPDDAMWNVDVPEWATKAKIIGTWGGVLARAGGARANVWVRLAANDPAEINTRAGGIDTTQGTDVYRLAVMTGDTVDIPAALRGKTITCLLMGQLISAPNAAATPLADENTTVALDIEWVETPAQDA